MRELGIDIETYSSNDLPSCGVYKYVEAPDFTILLFAYSIDGGQVVCCDFASGEQLPDEVLAALLDPAVVKTAFNAALTISSTDICGSIFATVLEASASVNPIDINASIASSALP